MYTFDENSISDLHKDAYGFRPDQSFWSFFAAANPDQKQALWDGLLVDLKRSVEEERVMQEEAVVKFENRVENLMHDGTTRKRVIEWLMDADESLGDVEYFEYLNGLPYGYLKSKEYA